jgi:hypothetical protein
MLERLFFARLSLQPNTSLSGMRFKRHPNWNVTMNGFHVIGFLNPSTASILCWPPFGGRVLRTETDIFTMPSYTLPAIREGTVHEVLGIDVI